jgi:uncharacterized protein (TIGR00299 family) protein
MQASVTTCYLDCFSGISGDMLLGAFFHAGFPQDVLSTELNKITGFDFGIKVKNEIRSGISCNSVQIHSPSQQQFRHLGDILDLLKNSTLPPPIIDKAEQIFIRLAEAEAKVHNVDLAKIHFHEVGAVDTIVDVVGTLIALDFFGIHELHCSPLPMGRGFVHCDHGKLPLPAPAVCELLQNVPVYGVEQEAELVTPTGAVLAVQLADTFGSIPSMTIQHVGYGAGSNSFKNDQPNLLRLIIGEKQETEESQSVEIIETNLDDWNTETFPYLCELLFAAGALDVSLSPLLMKKGRPGHCLQVIATPQHTLPIKQIILSETSAIGLRFRQEKRMTLSRKRIEVDTEWGMVEAKQVKTPGGQVLYPEYEACRRIAIANNVPLARVYRAIVRAEQKEE